MLTIELMWTECNAAQNDLMWKNAELNPKELGIALAPPSVDPPEEAGKCLSLRSPLSKRVQTQTSRGKTAQNLDRLDGTS